ncbi:hypothetical protein [Streptomyces acidicola]|uniref:hypothetical protein n=1 Tax=Streptomyces acidicola TaxID=2596892 RepID=UPI0038153113
MIMNKVSLATPIGPVPVALLVGLPGMMRETGRSCSRPRSGLGSRLSAALDALPASGVTLVAMGESASALAVAQQRPNEHFQCRHSDLTPHRNERRPSVEAAVHQP